MPRRDHKAAAKQRAKTIKKMMVDTETTPADLAEELGLKVRTVHKLLRCERTTMRRYDEMEQILKAHQSATNHRQTA